MYRALNALDGLKTNRTLSSSPDIDFDVKGDYQAGKTYPTSAQLHRSDQIGLFHP